MLIGPDERVPIARLLTVLEYGERVAHECALAQAVLTKDSKTRRFLMNQSRQEAMHAVVFQSAIAWLAPKHLNDVPVLPALEEYHEILDAELARGNLLETYLAEQVVFEGLGETTLSRIEQGLAKRGAPFGRTRRILLQQEEEHHGFGCRQLEQAIRRGETDRDALRQRAQRYLMLTDSIIYTLCDLFDSIDEDVTAWVADVKSFVPRWLLA